MTLTRQRSELALQEQSYASSKVKFLEKKIFELEAEKKSREAVCACFDAPDMLTVPPASLHEAAGPLLR